MFSSTVKALLKTTLARFLLTLAVAINLGAFLLARALGINLELVVAAFAIATLIVAMLLERVIPYAPHWNQSHQDIGIDIPSTAVLLGLVDPLLKYLAPIAAVALYGLLDISDLYSQIVGQMSFLWQLVIVSVLLELARYWMHRLHHSVRWLWWLHAMHHSSERLHALNNFRFHPLNYALMFVASIFPFVLIGTPAEVLFGYLALSLPVIMLQHANIDLRSGLFNYVFSTNELHRWHHSSSAAQANSNYGHALILWDQLFGTFKYQRSGNNMPTAIGLFRNSRQHYPMRASYLSQLLSMFSKKCCHR